MKIYQECVTVRGAEYYDFFYTPGSHRSLQWWINIDYNLKFIKDDSENKIAVVVFERIEDD